MKRCPQCFQVYPDDSLNFCRNDGAQLIMESDSLSGQTLILPGRDTGTSSGLRSTGPTSTTSSLSAPGRRKVSRRIINSLAVLPLLNVGHDPEMEYFSDGITESIINALTQLPKLRVVPRSTVFRYKGTESDPQDVGRELDVRAVLTGRVLQLGDRLVVKIELVDVANESQIWGEQYNRKPADIFEVQEEIAKEISKKLLSKLSGEEKKRLSKRHTHDAEAYRHYLKGRFHWNKRTEDNFRKGIEHFQQAIAVDPGYALAYAGLADSYILLGFYGAAAPDDVMPKAKAAAVKALELDDSVAEAHSSLAYLHCVYEWNWSGSEKEFKKAIKLNPNYATAHHWYAFMLAAEGRHAESIAQMKLAAAIDPLALIIITEVGWAYYFARQYDRAIKHYRRGLDMDPGFGVAHMFLGSAYVQQGRHAEAIAELQQGIELSGGSALMKAMLGHAYAVAGEREAALRIVDELKHLAEGKGPTYDIALIYAGLGERDETFAWLEAAYKQRALFLAWINREPMFDSVRSDPRFADIVKRIGLEPQSTGQEAVAM